LHSMVDVPFRAKTAGIEVVVDAFT